MCMLILTSILVLSHFNDPQDVRYFIPDWSYWGGFSMFVSASPDTLQAIASFAEDTSRVSFINSEQGPQTQPAGTDEARGLLSGEQENSVFFASGEGYEDELDRNEVVKSTHTVVYEYDNGRVRRRLDPRDTDEPKIVVSDQASSLLYEEPLQYTVSGFSHVTECANVEDTFRNLKLIMRGIREVYNPSKLGVSGGQEKTSQDASDDTDAPKCVSELFIYRLIDNIDNLISTTGDFVQWLRLNQYQEGADARPYRLVREVDSNSDVTTFSLDELLADEENGFDLRNLTVGILSSGPLYCELYAQSIELEITYSSSVHHKLSTESGLSGEHVLSETGSDTEKNTDEELKSFGAGKGSNQKSAAEISATVTETSEEKYSHAKNSKPFMNLLETTESLIRQEKLNASRTLEPISRRVSSQPIKKHSFVEAMDVIKLKPDLHEFSWICPVPLEPCPSDVQPEGASDTTSVGTMVSYAGFGLAGGLIMGALTMLSLDAYKRRAEVVEECDEGGGSETEELPEKEEPKPSEIVDNRTAVRVEIFENHAAT